MLTYDVHVAMGAHSDDHTPHIKCNDTGVNLCVFPELVTKLSKFREKREAYKIPERSTAVIRIAKPDKTFVVQDGEITGNHIHFGLAPQSFTSVGAAKAEVNIYGQDGRRVTSGTFMLEVTKECISESTPDSKPYVDILGDCLQEIKDAADTAATAAEEAEAAAEEIKKIVDGGEIVGPPGPPGEDGKDGEPGPPGEPGRGVESMAYYDTNAVTGEVGVYVWYTDGTTGQIWIPGLQGAPGRGIKSMGYYDTDAQGNIGIVVEYTDETMGFVWIPGLQGPPGPSGEPGAPGEPGKDGKTPERGVDYWTEADKAEIKSYVDEAILGGAW